jgi:methionyl-tRNA synthetase
VERVKWGIPVPDDASQSIYVWLDALMNYAAQTGYPHYDRMEPGGWPADVHVVGKDIIRFHCIYWPAFLMALNLPLPKRIVSHAHWTIGEEKMSKSVGNVVDPFQVMDVFGVDVVRWYLAMNGQLENDADWNNERLVSMHRVLRGQFGNLASRVLRGKGWSVRHSLTEAFRPDLDFMDQFVQGADARTLASLTTLRDDVLRGVDECDVRKGVNATMATIGLVSPPPRARSAANVCQANASFQDAHPWDMMNLADPTDVPRRLSSTIALAAETLRICGILLQPYMPAKCRLLLDQLGVDEAKRTAEYAMLAADMEYGTPMAALGSGYNQILFPPVLAA